MNSLFEYIREISAAIDTNFSGLNPEQEIHTTFPGVTIHLEAEHKAELVGCEYMMNEFAIQHGLTCQKFPTVSNMTVAYTLAVDEDIFLS